MLLERKKKKRNENKTSGNHTPSTKPILPERVTLLSGEISIVHGDELHDGAERGPVDRDGVRRTRYLIGASLSEPHT